MIMFRCYVCKSLHSSGSYLVQHLKLLHGLYPGKKLNLCAQDGFSLEFKSYSGFRKHLKRWHSDDAEPSSSHGLSFGTPALPLDRSFSSEESLNLPQNLSENGHS